MLTEFVDLVLPGLALAFSSPALPKPAPPPVNPEEGEEAARQRDIVARQATVDLAASGRRTTMFAGQRAALEAQVTRGKRRRGYASEELNGL